VTARDRAEERWTDTAPELDLGDVLREAARGTVREGDLAKAATLVCDAWGVREGPLLFRLGMLAERARAVRSSGHGGDRG
jgi:hypothetical protein